MIVKFTTAGESPDIGRFEAGEEMKVEENIGQLLVLRGIAKAIDTAPKKSKTEVKENGRNG